MQRAFNPGNIHVRLGAAQSLYEQAVFAGDLATASSVLGVIATYCKVHLTKAERLEYDALPGFAYGDEREPERIFSDMNNRLLYLLDAVKDHGIFTRAEAAWGDASSLDEEEVSA